MALGPGRYDDLLTEARKKAGATSAILIILDGKDGSGFACQTTPDVLIGMPELLESVAEELRATIEADMRRILGLGPPPPPGTITDG